MGLDRTFWNGRRVLVTGHTGFKGAWLTAWLEHLGAEVHGVSLAPTPGAMYALVERWDHASTIADLRTADLDALVREADPEVVLYLAAQAIVLTGYEQPELTWETNVMGPVRTLAALRACPSLRAIVLVTSDKVYGDRRRDFVETDPLAAGDPYSGSKVAQEAVAASFRYSYFGEGPGLVTARAGNVIGGGDDAEFRILPDCVRAIRDRAPLRIRHPEAVRPWQHVLEPLHGYLAYAQAVAAGDDDLPTALNFAPHTSSAASVEHVVDAFLGAVAGGDAVEVVRETPADAPREVGFLSINPGAARAAIGWEPALDLGTGISWSADWYSAALRGQDLRAITLSQIAEYEGLIA